QKISSASVSAHACCACAWTERATTSGGSATRTGTGESAVDPLPSCPRSFAPQQYTWPLLASTPHVNSPPASIDVKRNWPLTGRGTAEEAVSPDPSCPRPFAPQQYAPSGVCAQVCSQPSA